MIKIQKMNFLVIDELLIQELNALEFLWISDEKSTWEGVPKSTA
jgi:hypothetical protein